MTSTVEAPPAPAHAAHGHGAHDPHLAHHFDTPEQQFDAGKLGIWVFLVTEVLFFSGLFCAYAIWRKNHPEIFVYAHHYLSTFWGAVNTGVLLFSSLTAAWAVRSAQLGNKKGLILNLVLTLVCAFGFLGVKTVEYGSKISHGTLPGQFYEPHPDSVLITTDGYTKVLGTAGDLARESLIKEHGAGYQPSEEELNARTLAVISAHDPEPPAVRTFFSIYFCMTGLHGIHVVAGIIVFLWILARAMRGDFGPRFFGPVDYSALYWHLVDLVWIYLFPLLYLIK
jgi:cytochrome c oxidase subunit 3